MKRFTIIETGDYDSTVVHEFDNDSTEKAIAGFNTLYGTQDGFYLFEQVACSEPARSCDETDNSRRAASLHTFPGVLVNPSST